jgi:ammonia channel protein AmtB
MGCAFLVALFPTLTLHLSSI